MKTIINLSIASSLIASMYHAPMTTLVVAIATVFALDLIGRYCTNRQQQVSQGNAAYDEIKDLFQAADEIMDKDIYQDEQPDDIWDATEVTTCDLASVTIPVQPVLALPAAADVIIVDYSSLSYRELQQKVKALRTKKNNIKLTSKKQQLIDWLNRQSV